MHHHAELASRLAIFLHYVLTCDFKWLQVRLWRTERTKDEILRYMRVSGGDDLMGQRQDMIAYWDFNEPDEDRQATPAAVQYSYHTGLSMPSGSMLP